MSPVLLLLLACAGGGGDSGTAGDGGSTDGGTDSGATDGGTDSGATDGGTDSGTTDGGTDSGTTDGGTTGVALGCPAGMSAVPPVDPVYCIDTYEVTVVDGVPTSQAGVIPTIGISYEDSVATCADAPVTGADGTVLSERWLATVDQWRDAMDNQQGDGGDSYPWGDEWVDGRCASTLGDGTVVLDGLVETGSYPDCVSEAGVYDQVGNAFEWADPGLYLDTAAFLDERAAEGRPFTIEDDGDIYVPSGDISSLRVEIAGVGGIVQVDEDGLLWLDGDASGAGEDFWGYLLIEGADSLDPAMRLGIEYEDLGGGSIAIRHRASAEGQPVPAKMGCPYYVGDAGTCVSSNQALNHTYDFDGTIGFRCASEPVPLDAL